MVTVAQIRMASITIIVIITINDKITGDTMVIGNSSSRNSDITMAKEEEDTRIAIVEEN